MSYSAGMLQRAVQSPRRTHCCRFLATQSDQRVVNNERDVIQRLKTVVEPVTTRSLWSLGMVQKVRVTPEGNVSIDIDPIVPGYPRNKQLRAFINEKLRTLDWVRDVRVHLNDCNDDAATDQTAPAALSSDNSSVTPSAQLDGVAHVIGVSSCKGGVGKSTVAVNLALSLASRGLRTGILDADVYGPSLPHLLEAEDLTVKRSSMNPKHVLPLDAKGYGGRLKMLSFGHVNPKSGAPGAGGKEAAVVRGPIAARIINQLLLGTDWGELDYLVIDLPPGTGDVQMTVCQSAALSGSVLVTTPHSLALLDAAKGVAMFETMKVPTLTVVENMAYFKCEHGSINYPFGEGGRENLLKGIAALYGTEEEHATAVIGSAAMVDTYERIKQCPLHSLPLDPHLNTVPFTAEHHRAAELGETVLETCDSLSARFDALADDVISELFKTQIQAVTVPVVSVSTARKVVLLRYFTASSAIELSVPMSELRRRDPATGALLKDEYSTFTNTSSEEPTSTSTIINFELKGHYGVAFQWSDGHFADIFSYDTLKTIAEECQQENADS